MLEYPELVQSIAIASLTLFWLRATIDRHKGALIEVLAVTAPIALTALAAWIDNPQITMQALGERLTPIVVFLFWSLPTLIAVRLGARLWQGEQPQLADMFRITTITALGIFVLLQLEVDPQAVLVVTAITVVYLAGDIFAEQYTAIDHQRARQRIARPRARWWPSPSIVWLVVIAGFLILMNSRSTAFASYCNLMIGLYLSPIGLHWLMRIVNRQATLGYWSQALVTRLVRASDSIYHRTLFRLWHFRSGVCFLNHGSFGAVPLRIQRAQRAWQARCLAEPMDILARETEPAWQIARDRLAAWLGGRPECMALSENATVAMNEIASWFPLDAGDEVLLTDHEYGAVRRIWERRSAKSSAVLRTATLPMPFDEPQRIVDAILSACTERTRIVVFSHITSPTAVILPVAEICSKLRERGIASCIDGPHALLQESIHLEDLGCDFYTASCHKWLCAPLGSGFVYVHPRWTERIEPLRMSWGRLPPGRPMNWTDELTWIGTRDYSPYMTIPAAIDFFEGLGREWLEERNFALACYARRVLCDSLRTQAVTPESRHWMGWMAAVWLPPGDHSGLQQTLWNSYRIEVPIVHFNERYLVRVSCHLYNTTQDIDRLARALQNELSAAAQ